MIRYSLRSLLNPLRKQPDFIILGAQKGGTTSLFDYLVQHPSIVGPTKKEIHYFNINHDKGLGWYHQHFPIALNKMKITGEASPMYLFHPDTPARIKSYKSDLKFIVLLRNPVLRAYSQYNMSLRNKQENRSFEKAVDEEMELLEKHNFNILELHENLSADHFQNRLYLARGLYASQIKTWLNCFDNKNFLFLNSEDFYANTAEAYTSVLSFLGLDQFDKISFKKLNSGSYVKLSDHLSSKLSSFFKPHTSELNSITLQNFNWFE